MLDKLTERLDFHGNALLLRAERQRALASNIANADTPGYVARDFNFSDALRDATGQGSGASLGTAQRAIQRQQSASDPRHIPLPAAASGSSTASTLGYTVQTQPSLDNNTVDLDRERAAFADNAVRYEATLRFINGNARTMLSAIQGQ
ncbi:flagellar basal body rod protein FlgB [Paracidovorax konjaci]|uniref:Flagellar basal body rod protein FlgB n=1 Tax=Paracidovorax konjaci TaxID=32040 RepID=A0A1I1YN12_9BURK|nr:flagellar basal body rod protein FlgB [Paracidovorax konjaci]SFE20994.1 flagellar basal-body rod protein FlgB [Paracidovorax konjaci]